MQYINLGNIGLKVCRSWALEAGINFFKRRMSTQMVASREITVCTG